MAYTLQTSREGFRGGKNILASEDVKFLEVGGTLDAKKFGAKVIELGTAVARNTTSGKFEPYTETTPDTFEPGFEDIAILNIDVDCNGVDDVIVGELIIRGSVYEQKLPAVPTDAFKAKNDNIRYLKDY